MPGRRGGMLRRGGGKLAPKFKEEALEAIREGLPDVIRALKAKAVKGDAKAIELCLHYGIGKPVERVEMSGPEGGPIEHLEALMPDEEKRALHDAIARELDRRAPTEEPVDREAAPAPA